MNIGIYTDGFLNLIGAFDFINNIICAMDRKAESTHDNIYIFITREKFYKEYHGIKRILKKIQYFISASSQYSVNDKFKIYKNVKVVTTSKNISVLIKKYKLTCMFPVQDINQKKYNIPTIGYLYDCQHKYYPNFFSDAEINYRNKYFAKIVKDYCIVNSIDTKNDLIKFYNADKNKIFALPFTPKLNIDYLEDNSELIKKYNLPEKYFLSSNQFWIHKDHSTLFKAYAKLIQNEEFKDIKLICTGTMEEYRNPNYINDLKQLLHDLNIENDVYLLGLIPKKEQIEIMKKCVAVVQTTLFEGGPGGGSVWDACALGKRSIVSNIRVNLEIDDNLVTFFDVGNVDDLVEKMKLLLITKHLEYTKKDLIIKNNNNIEKLGNSLYEIINQVVANNQTKKENEKCITKKST